jgi:hypothetical protein
LAFGTSHLQVFLDGQPWRFPFESRGIPANGPGLVSHFDPITQVARQKRNVGGCIRRPLMTSAASGSHGEASKMQISHYDG